MNFEYINQTNEKSWKNYRPYICQIVSRTITVLKLDKKYDFSIILVDSNTIQEINREYRKIDKVTDVISFASLDDESLMSKLIDIHNHVLPIDDGAKDYRDSLRMLQDAVESNISTVFVSPHIIPKGKYCPTVEFILDEVVKLKEMAKDIPIEIKYGSEFQVNADSMAYIENKQYLCYEIGRAHV